MQVSPGALGFWHGLERHGDRVALLCPTAQGHQDITYAELAALADDYAAQLTAAGAGQGRKLLVAVVMQPRLGTLAAYLGALRAGHTVLLVDDTVLSPENRIGMQFPFDVILHEDEGAAVQILTCTDPLTETVALHPDLAVLLSTSGSTGEAKLVRLSEKAVQSNALAIADYLNIDHSSRAILTLPLFYSYGMSVLHSYLAAGASVILNDHAVTEPAFWADAERLGATSLALVPHQCQTIERSEFQTYPISTLRYVTQAGGRLDAPLIDALHARGQDNGWQLYVMYGQTEAAPRMSYVPPETLPEAAQTIGRAIPGGQLDIRDEDGALITEPGRTGELIYTGPNVMMGYAQTPADLAKGADLQELATGDLAQWADNGFVRIVGRLKRFVKLYGMRVSLDEVESLLGGAEIEAYAAGSDQTLVLLLPDMAHAQQARELVAARLKVPAHDIVASPLETLPLLANGKRDQQRLNEMAAEVAQSQESGKGRAARSLAAVFAEATRSRSVRPEDSFSTLGGDSLGFLQVSLDLESRLGHVPDGWEDMTLAELEALEPVAKPVSTIGTDIIVRVLAISMIVLNHTFGGGWNGGTWVLLMATGLSFYRFQIPSLGQTSPFVALLKLLYPLLPLYFLSLLALAAIGKSPPLPLLTLTANFAMDSEAFFFNVNWFISMYTQVILILVALFSLPPLWRRARAQPVGTMVGLFGLSVLISLLWQAWILRDLGDFGLYESNRFWVRSTITCMAMVTLGLLIGAARQHRKYMPLALAAVVVNAWAFPTLSVVHAVSLLVGGALLVMPGSVPVPALVGRLARNIASAALFIYLLHPFVLHVFKYVLPLKEMFGAVGIAVPALVLSFAISWAALAVFRFVERLALRGLAALRQRSA